MVKKITTEETVDDEKATEREEMDSEVVRALVELEGSQDIRWQIHRMSQPDPGYLGELSTSELSLQRIADDFGAGRYKIKGIKPDGTYYKSGTVSIAKVAKKDATSMQDLLTAMRGDKGSGDLVQIMTLMMNQQQAAASESTKILCAALQRPESKPFPWEALAAAIPPGLVALKEFFQNKSDPMKQMMDAITLTEKLRGKESDDKGATIPDLIRDGIHALPAALQSFRTPSTVQATVTPPSSNQQPVTETPTAIEPPEEIKAMQWLKSQLELLVQKAAENRNVELYAEVFLEELPAFIPDDTILSLLNQVDWFEQLIRFEPRVGSYRGWFEGLRESIIASLEQDTSNDRPDERSDSKEPTA